MKCNFTYGEIGFQRNWSFEPQSSVLSLIQCISKTWIRSRFLWKCWCLPLAHRVNFRFPRMVFRTLYNLSSWFLQDSSSLPSLTPCPGHTCSLMVFDITTMSMHFYVLMLLFKLFPLPIMPLPPSSTT